MERFQAVCQTENKELGKPQEKQSKAQAIADSHRHDSGGHETNVFRVISSNPIQLIEKHVNLDKGAKGEILSGPFGENKIYHIRFDGDKNVNFRKVPSAKLKTTDK